MGHFKEKLFQRDSKNTQSLTTKFYDFQKAGVVRIAWPDYPEKGSLLYWRALVLFSILFAGLMLATPAAVTGIIAGAKENAWGLVLFDLGGYLFCIFLLFSKNIRYAARASITLMICYCVGIVVITSLGPLSGGPAWLFTFAVLAGVLLGSRAALLAVLINALSLSTIALFIFTHRVGIDFPFFRTPQAMIAAGVNFLVLNTIAAVSVSALVKGLVQTNQKMEKMAEDLKQEGRELIRAKDDLESQVKVRKQTEKALAESEKKYRSFIENAPMAMYTINLKGELTYGNRKLAEITGYKSEDWLGKPFFSIVHQDDLGIVAEKMQKRIDGKGSDDPYEIRIFRSSGNVMWVEIVSELIFEKTLSGKKQLAGVQAFVTDITRRKEVESERARLQRELYQARKMESIGTLAGGIAHNFNNFLMGIQGRTSILLINKPHSHPDYNNLKSIESYINKAASLTRQLLGFARGGKYEVKNTDLNRLLRHSADMFGETRKEVLIHHDHGDIPLIEADQGQIEQMLMNLYVNAWQAMPQGGDLYISTDKITISEAYEKPFKIEPGVYVKVSITDTGVGMDKKTRTRIFEPFFTTQEVGKGTGLGLASVYGIVKNHGGFINVYSEKGIGTTFNVYLPAGDPLLDSADIPDTGEKEIHSFQHTRQLSNETILLVDDEKMILDVGREMMERLDYKVLTAQSGKEAIALYQKQRDTINMVVLDMVMPGMSGGETFDRLKASNPDVKVLLSSGYSMNGRAEEIINRGCSGFIQKPFTIEEISRKISKILYHHS